MFGVSRSIVAVCTVLSLGSFTTADAAFTLDFNTAYTGATPSGTGPFLTAKFEDGTGVDTGKVLLTLTADLNATSEFISAIAFNFTGSTKLSLTNISGPPATLVHPMGPPGPSAYNGWGNAGSFDFGIEFTNANSADRFQLSEVVKVWLSSTVGIAASNFNTSSSENVLAAVHVQGIAASPGSGKLGGEIPPPPEDPPSEIPGVPEPGTLALLALGSIGLGGYHKLRSKKEVAA